MARRPKGWKLKKMGLFQPDFDRHPYLKNACFIMSIVALGLAVVWARAFYGSMQAYRQGEIDLKAHRHVKAITFFDRSLHWFAPFNPYQLRSAQRLWEIGRQAEQNGDIRLALIAYRTIRRGFWAATSLYTPGKAWIQRCDVRISELTGLDQPNRASSGSPSGAVNGMSAGQKTKDVSSFWSIILEIGFLGWIATAIGFIIFACKDHREARFATFQAIAWGAMTLTFFVLWLVGMMKA